MQKNICLKKSPIKEVVFEVVFKKDFKWDPTIPGIFFEKISSKFPNKASVQEKMVEFKLSPDDRDDMQNFSQNEIPQFLTGDKKIFVLLKKNSISIHHVEEYTSWKKFSELIKFAYDKYLEVVKKTTDIDISKDDIAHLGLKYVNKIKIPQENFLLKNYFNFRPIDICEDKSLEAFIVGGVFIKENSRLRVQVNSTMPTEGFLNFILNLYCYSKDGNSNIIKWLNNAHDNIEEKFLQALTKKTISLFD